MLCFFSFCALIMVRARVLMVYISCRSLVGAALQASPLGQSSSTAPWRPGPQEGLYADLGCEEKDARRGPGGQSGEGSASSSLSLMFSLRKAVWYQQCNFLSLNDAEFLGRRISRQPSLLRLEEIPITPLYLRDGRGVLCFFSFFALIIWCGRAC